MTDSEKKLWPRLRRKPIMDIPFYRQKPIGPYIVDFYAPKAKIVIEVDESQHMEEDPQQIPPNPPLKKRGEGGKHF